LTPCRMELNPTEKLWAVVKNWVVMKKLHSSYKILQNWQKKNTVIPRPYGLIGARGVSLRLKGR
jgi:transposase